MSLNTNLQDFATAVGTEFKADRVRLTAVESDIESLENATSINDGETSLTSVWSSSKVSTELAGKAAASHSHAISGVTGLQAALDAKSAIGHTHSIANVTNLQATLDGKAAATHAHIVADVTGLQAALDGKASASHTHTIANVTGLQTALNGKADSSAVGALISDTTTGTSTVWSSTKTNSEITSKINAVVAGAPAALDTLKEIADALSAGDSAATALAAQVTNLKTDLGPLDTDLVAVLNAAMA